MYLSVKDVMVNIIVLMGKMNSSVVSSEVEI